MASSVKIRCTEFLPTQPNSGSGSRTGKRSVRVYGTFYCLKQMAVSFSTSLRKQPCVTGSRLTIENRTKEKTAVFLK